MQLEERWQDLLAEAGLQQRLMDLLCSSAITEYCSNGRELFCGKGCSSCCTLAVNCTAAEALLIASALEGTQQKAVSVYVARLKERVAGVADLKAYLRMHRQELGSCPFLDNGSCGVYPSRPLSCRALLSTKEGRWCGTDFSELSTEEKQAFLDSLDRSVTAFPLHYLASTQNAGRELEMQAAMLMLKETGFSIYGSMPVLVHLFAEFNLLDCFTKGVDSVLERIASAGLDNTFLLQVDTL